jgi:hypothetical protein
MVKYLIRFTEYFVYLGLLTFLFFDLTVHYWVQAIVKPRTSYVILALLLWSLLFFLIDKGRDTFFTKDTFAVFVSIVCFAAWGLVMFLMDSGGYAERLNIYTSAVAGCVIAVAGILRPRKFFNIHLLSGMYAFTVILSIYALFFYRSYLELMNIEAQFVPYSIPGEIDKNSFAYMLLFGFLIGIYVLHQIKSTTLKRVIYLPQIFLVVLLFNAGSRQVLIMMLVCALVYLKNTMPYFLRSRKTLVRHFLSALLAILLVSALVLSSENTRLLFYRLGFASSEAGEYGEMAERSDDLRKQISADSLDRFLSSPIIGTGVADTVIEQTQNFQVSEHNYLLQLACSEGIIGLAFFVAIFFFTYLSFRHTGPRCDAQDLDGSISVAVIKSMFSIVFLSLFFSPMKNLHWIVLTWVIIVAQGPRRHGLSPAFGYPRHRATA